MIRELLIHLPRLIEWMAGPANHWGLPLVDPSHPAARKRGRVHC
jgi:hypothetical protein